VSGRLCRDAVLGDLQEVTSLTPSGTRIAGRHMHGTAQDHLLANGKHHAVGAAMAVSAP
jgi:hypothetical protein